MKICPKCFVKQEDDALARCPDDNRELLPLEGKDHALGEVLAGRFLLTGFLGRGAMGAVYKGYQVSMRRYVAVKVLLPHIASSDQHVQRFIREATSAAQLKSPHTVTLYDFGETDDGRLFIAMELLAGKELADILDDVGRFRVDEALDIISQACLSLEEAHERQIIHRDLKPANMMVEKRPDNPYFVKIVDFGIAKLLDEGATMVTQDGSTCGTPSYMAPEQVMGRDLDARTDIYALGVVLFELVTGKRPFTDGAATAILLKHLQEPIPSVLELYPELSIPARVDQVIQRCVAKRPEERFASCLELREACQSALNPSEAPATEAYREVKQAPDQTAQSFPVDDDETAVQETIQPAAEPTLTTDALAETMADEAPVQVEETPYDQTEAIAPAMESQNISPPGSPKWLWPAVGAIVVVLLIAAGLFVMSANQTTEETSNETSGTVAEKTPDSPKETPATETKADDASAPQPAAADLAAQAPTADARRPADVPTTPDVPPAPKADVVAPAKADVAASPVDVAAQTGDVAPAKDLAGTAPAEEKPVEGGAAKTEEAVAEVKKVEKKVEETVEKKTEERVAEVKKVEKKAEATVSVRSLKVTGSLDEGAAKKAVKKARRKLNKCIDKPGWSSDQLSVTVMLAPTGKAKSVKVDPSGAAADCAKSALSGLSYPTFEGNFAIIRFKVKK